MSTPAIDAVSLCRGGTRQPWRRTRGVRGRSPVGSARVIFVPTGIECDDDGRCGNAAGFRVERNGRCHPGRQPFRESRSDFNGDLSRRDLTTA